MISVCCCSINSKFEAETFIEVLQVQNEGTEFEVVLTLDDRVEDGAREYLGRLEKKYKNVRIVLHTEQDTINYFTAALDYYDRKQLLTPKTRQGMRRNLEKYKEGTFPPDRTKAFLWQSSGILYNKAVKASRGDIIVVTPGDFLYLFPLRTLEGYVRRKAKRGLFYASLPTIFINVTNQDREWVEKEIHESHRKRPSQNWPRWVNKRLSRSYLRYPAMPGDVVLPDIRNDLAIEFGHPRRDTLLRRFCEQAGQDTGDGIGRSPAFHGFHVMTREVYRTIGGFTEEWIHRAFADDKMTRLGERLAGYSLPPRFSVAWCDLGAVDPGEPGLEQGKDWREKALEVDPYFGRHPVPPLSRGIFLHEGVATLREV